MGETKQGDVAIIGPVSPRTIRGGQAPIHGTSFYEVLTEALIERMRRTAVSELARHVPEGGLCASCGEAWPCDRARLADLALS